MAGAVKAHVNSLDPTDLLHYETRAIREQLHSSRARLTSAKARARADLLPVQSILQEQELLQDWNQPTVNVDLTKDDTLASGDPMYEEMRTCLLQFGQGHGAAAKERAFYSALRTLLSEIVLDSKGESRCTKTMAAHKWFTRHRPRGFTDDPAISAALAASLSIQSMTSVPRAKPAASDPSKPFVTQGTKHEFFALYSKEGPSEGGDADVRSASHASAGPGPRTALSELASRRAAAVRESMPVVLHPAVPSVRTASSAPYTTSARVARPPGQQPAPHPASARTWGASGPHMSRPHQGVDQEEEEEQEGGERKPTVPSDSMLVPKSKARVAFNPNKNSSGGGKTQPGPGQQWFSGPYQAGSVHAGLYAPPMSRVQAVSDVTHNLMHRNDRVDAEEAEVEQLRRKWSSMDEQSNKGVAHAEQQVQQWSIQRARLEEEIIRRQEASRFAAPAPAGAKSPPTSSSPHLQGQGHLSPYADLVSEKVGADHSLPTMTGLFMPPSVASIARAVRSCAQPEYARDEERINKRVSQLGLTDVLRHSLLEAALAPVPDKAFLDCIARLPKPGHELQSRPSTVRGSSKSKSSSKKKRGASAGKTRPSSSRESRREVKGVKGMREVKKNNLVVLQYLSAPPSAME